MRLLEVLRDSGIETHLVMSEAARRVAELETGYSAADIEALADYSYANERDRRAHRLGLVPHRAA